MLTRERTQAGRTLRLLLPLLLHVGTSGSNPITGPEEVSGMERGSLTVPCRYDPEWKTYRKWWCRGAAWSSCQILVQTTGSEREKREGRVSIMDSQGNFTFTVTMEELRLDDADTYWCGIERTGVDLGVTVKVTIGPDVAEPVTTDVAELVTTDVAELVTASALASLASSPPVTQGVNSSMAVTNPLTRSLLCNIHFLLLTFIKVPLLGVLLCTVVWLNRHQRDSRGKLSQSEWDRSPRAINTHTSDLQNFWNFYQAPSSNRSSKETRVPPR
ncbi:CMRF35-like molecule 5 [Pteropus medius]|uniref:CMRF35-like molecule 5 n=1 Tax=Pteropus vampyrus TaxID=132908 RepID=UPI00196AFD94|nr:CMRF35-like molecule 5 [Pteropus giganteus]